MSGVTRSNFKVLQRCFAVAEAGKDGVEAGVAEEMADSVIRELGIDPKDFGL